LRRNNCAVPRRHQDWEPISYLSRRLGVPTSKTFFRLSRSAYQGIIKYSLSCNGTAPQAATPSMLCSCEQGKSHTYTFTGILLIPIRNIYINASSALACVPIRKLQSTSRIFHRLDLKAWRRSKSVPSRLQSSISLLYCSKYST